MSTTTGLQDSKPRSEPTCKPEDISYSSISKDLSNIDNPIVACKIYTDLLILSRHIYVEGIDEWHKGVSSFVIGFTGIGKTWLIRRFYKQYHNDKVYIVEDDINTTRLKSIILSLYEKAKSVDSNRYPSTLIISDFGNSVGKNPIVVSGVMNVLKSLVEEGINHVSIYRGNIPIVDKDFSFTINCNAILFLTPKDFLNCIVERLEPKGIIDLGTLMSRFLIFTINFRDIISLEKYKEAIRKGISIISNDKLIVPDDTINIPLSNIDKDILNSVSELAEYVYEENFTRLEISILSRDVTNKRYYDAFVKLLVSLSYYRKGKVDVDEEDLSILEDLALDYLVIPKTRTFYEFIKTIKKVSKKYASKHIYNKQEEQI